MPDTALLLSRDGERHVIAQSASPIKDSHGKIAGMVLVFRDISEGRKMEEELLKARNLESLSILAGGIAHDFNNILTVIIGNISLAKMGIDSGTRAHGLLGEAEKASWRARDLTQQLLTFSKGGAPVKKITSISELLKDTVSFTLSGSNIRCTFLLPEDLWPAEVDAGQVSQVINNLVINAQQAMPAGGTIEIAAENAHLPPVRRTGKREPAASSRTRRRFIKIKLADHGIGIPSEHLPKIFDPYFTTKQRGSGLGLTTAYSIVNKHGGHITVESEVGKGTSITVFLPATAERHRPKEKKSYKITPHKGRILLVDDEEPILDLGSKVIGSLGYEVEVARSGEEAVEIYRKARGTSKPFDAVIMDLTIPGGMGGKETLKRLREMDPAVRAIVSSGYSNDPVMSGYRSHGFRGVIAKPYTIIEVARTLRSVLGRKGKRKKT
jgi:signal transduction histidine kinase/CheY-like chemotaxis protein